MKTKRKWKERLGSAVIAALLAVQTVLAIVPPGETKADVKAIEEWDENELVDYKYRFNMKFQKGVTKAVPFGCDNKDQEAFTNHGRNGIYAATKRMTGNYTPESAGIRYYNVGKDGEGNIVDFQVTVVGVENADPRYDLLTPYRKYHIWKDGWEDTGDGFAWPGGMGQPTVAFSLGEIGMRTYCIGTVTVRFHFFKHNTEEPLPISGHGTLRDLDAGQGASIPPDSQIDHAFILKGNHFLKVEGTKVTAGDNSLNSGDKKGWLNFLYDTDQIRFRFHHQKRLDRWDEERKTGIEKHGSQEKWGNVVKKLYADPEGNSYCPEYDGGKLVRGHAYFDFTSYCLGDVEIRKEPEKRVGKLGISFEEGTGTDKNQPFVIQEYEEFQYMVQAELTPNHLNSFVIQDTLKECLTIDGTSKVIVKDELGDEVTGQFDIKIEGQTITCSAKQEYLKEEAFTNNQLYTFIFQVHRKEGADVSQYLQEDNYTFLVPNTAQMSYVRINGKGETKTTETVWVKGYVIPQLVVEKTASRYEWQVGDEIDYTVKVTQKKPNAWAVNTVVTDITIPPELTLLDGQYHVEAAPGVEHCIISKEGENGWKVQCPLLQYDESIQVFFRCKATEASNGREHINTSVATADNFFDPETGEPKEEKDMTEIWTNTPSLHVDKLADKYEWRVGDEVSYRVVVTNTTPGTVGRNVQISDIGLPQGLILSQGAGSVEVLNAPSQVEYPVPDKKTGQAVEVRQSESSLEADETGWSFYCSYLPYSHPVTVLFHCTATEACNGRENVNMASAQAENAPVASDDAEAYVNTGGFYIEKTADHYEWQVGEQVQYQVMVENQTDGTIARNVTIWDTSMPAGLALAGPEAVTVTGIPETIENPVAGTLDPTGQLNPEFCQETETKPVSYEFLPEGTGWRLNISDLPAHVPVMVQFFCTVTEAVNGMESINAAMVQAENAEPQKDDAEIYVNTAVLSIDKTVNNPYLQLGDGREANEFRVGEQVEYQVVVRNLQKGSIARNLMISDVSLPEGLALDGDENAIQVLGIPASILNPVAGTDDAGNQLDPENYNEVVEKPVEWQLVREGTGWKLMISDLPYDLPVTVRFLCTVQESVNGWEIINTAKASAQNGAEVKDTSKIWVNTPVLKIQKKADKPTYKYGDIATYRIVVTQEQIGCVARNVRISDIIDTSGVRLLKDSIVLLDEKGNMIEPEQVEANDNNTFQVYTGRSLIHPKGYTIFDGDQGGAFEQVLYNPLNFSSEAQMIVEYQAAVIDENLAGKTVHNIAEIISPEGYPAKDEETVEIHSPVLDIVKESDQKEYFVGETGYYKLTVRQLREDVTVQNVVVEDSLNHPGAVIEEGSILVRKNNLSFTPESIEAGKNGFRIVTGTSLDDTDKLEIFYRVVFESPELDHTAVVNMAKAKGENTPEEVTDLEVLVGDIRPLLEIEKISDKKVYKPGETGHYQVKVTQTEKDAVARNVLLKDILPDTLAVLQKDSVKIFDKNNVQLDKPEIEVTETGYRIHTGKDLGYQEFLVVTYDVKFPENMKEGEVLNVAMGTSDNLKPEPEKEAEPVMVGDGIKAVKTAVPPSGSIVKEGEIISYTIKVRNEGKEVRKNIMIKDAIPEFTSFQKVTGGTGEVIELDGKKYAGFFIEEIPAGQEAEVSFEVKREPADKDICVVNVAQVRSALADKEEITEETWKSKRFFNTNATVHFADTLWVKEEHEVEITDKEISPTPEPSKPVSPAPTENPSPAPSKKPTVVPTRVPTKKPVPTTGNCPGISKAPGAGSSGSGNYPSSGSGNYNSGNYPYGTMQGGSYASGAKTGDERPFEMMARAGVLGLVLLAAGIWMYRKSKKRKKKEE